MASRSISNCLILARYLVEPFGYGVDLHAQLSRSFVHQVDCFVGQEAVGDVAIAQLNGCNDRIIFDTYMVRGSRTAPSIREEWRWYSAYRVR